MKCAVLLLFLVPALSLSEETLRYSASSDRMGTTYTVIAYGEDARELQRAAGKAFDEVSRIEALLSNYREDSEWSYVNRNAGDGPVRVTSEMFRFLSMCIDYGRSSDGAFDITVGPLIKTWGFYRRSGRLPHRAEIRAALARVSYQSIELDEQNRTVRFRMPGTEIDSGGIGKGYTVDRMVEILRDEGIRSAFVSAGNSSIYAIGAPPRQQGWTVNLRDPRNEDQTVAEVVLNNSSISTSGDYEKFFVAGGTLYGHIFDPATGYPSTGTISVSVVAPTTTDSEAWTKPVFVRGRQWASRNVPEGFRVFICEEELPKSCAWLQ